MSAPAALIQGVSIEELELATPYAEAAWESAQAKGGGNDLADELEAFVRLVDAKAPGFDGFARVGTIDAGERTRVLAGLQPLMGEQAYRLLAVLNQHGRLNLYRAVAAAVREQAGYAAGTVRVVATSAAPLADEQKNKLRQQLAAKLKAEPQLEFTVDPALLGGLQVRIGETLYDYSVRANLARLRTDLLARSANEVQSGRDRVGSP